MNRKGCDSGFFILLGAGDIHKFMQMVGRRCVWSALIVSIVLISINEVLVRTVYRQAGNWAD
jgi:hypothetical protein